MKITIDFSHSHFYCHLNYWTEVFDKYFKMSALIENHCVKYEKFYVWYVWAQIDLVENLITKAMWLGGTHLVGRSLRPCRPIWRLELDTIHHWSCHAAFTYHGQRFLNTRIRRRVTFMFRIKPIWSSYRTGWNFFAVIRPPDCRYTPFLKFMLYGLVLYSRMFIHICHPPLWI